MDECGFNVAYFPVVDILFREYYQLLGCRYIMCLLFSSTVSTTTVNVVVEYVFLSETEPAKR